VSRRLIDTVPARRILAEAAERDRLADQVAVRRAELAALDDALDAELDDVEELAEAAGRIEELLDDLRLAEKLATPDPAALEAGLRRQLPAVQAGSVEQYTGGAGAVEALLRAQLRALAGEPAAAPPAGPVNGRSDQA
jgi:hypothetical protein